MRWPLVWRSTLDERDRAYERTVSEMAAVAGVSARELTARAGVIVQYGEWLAAADQREADRVVRYEREAIRAEARYADLMASYRTLRQQGFATPPPEPVATPAEKPDPVLAAINVVARDAKTRAAALRQVSIDRLAGLEDVEIVQRIHRGNRPAEEIA